MDLTGVANLALTHLAEPLLTDYATDTGTTAEYVRTHLTQCRDLVLEGHVWSFAKRFAALTEAPASTTTATLQIGEVADDNAILFTAVSTGPGGNDVSIAISATTAAALAIDVDGSAITITPEWTSAAEAATATATVSLLDLTTGDSLTIDGVTYTWSASSPYYGNQFGTPSDLIAAIQGQQAGSTPHPTVRVSGQSVVGLDTIISLQARTAGTAGNSLAISRVGTSITLSGSTFSGGAAAVTISVSTAADLVTAITADSAASLLVTAAAVSGSDGSGILPTTAATNLSGGSSTSSVYAPGYGSAFNLPTDCARLVKIDGSDRDIPRERFEIRGRYLLLFNEDEDPPVIEYITNDPPVDEWPATFVDAVAYLLASRLAPLVSKDQNLSAAMLQKHEMALAKARVRDARETRSRENWTPRQLLGRSHLYRSRFGGVSAAQIPIDES